MDKEKPGEICKGREVARVRHRPLPELYEELGLTLMGDAEELITKGLTAQALVRYEEAAQSFLNARREGGSSRFIALGLAHCREGQQRYNEALKEYLEAVLIDPSSAGEILPLAHPCLTPAFSRSLGSWFDITWTPAMLKTQLGPEARMAVELFLARVSVHREDYKSAVERYRSILATKKDAPYILGELGETLRKAGQPKEAVLALGDAIRFADPSTPAQRSVIMRLQLGLSLVELGRHQEAIRALRQALALGGSAEARTRAEIWTALARARLGLGRLEGALAAAEKASELDDKLASPHALVAVARLRWKQYQQAIDEAEAALNREPHDLIAIQAEGLAFLEGNIDAGQGIRLLRHYLEQVPSDTETMLLLARALRANGHPAQEVIELLGGVRGSDACTLCPDLNLELAQAHLDVGDPAAALAVLDSPDERGAQTDLARWWRIRGAALRLQNDTEKALEALQHALALMPADITTLRCYTSLLETKARFEDIVSAWQHGVQANPDSPELKLNLALAAQKGGGTTLSWSAVSEAIEAGLEGEDRWKAYLLRAELAEALLRPTDERLVAYYGAGREATDKGDFDQALRWLELTLGLDTAYEDARWLRIDILRRKAYMQNVPYRDAAMTAEARQAWNETVQHSGLPGQNHAWAYISAALIAQSEWQLSSCKEREALIWEGVSYLERSLVLGPENLYAWVYLSALHRSAGNYENALQASERALGINKSDPAVVEERAVVLADCGESGQFKDLTLDSSVKISPWLQPAQAYISYITGKFWEAVDTLTILIEADKNDIWSLSLRGDCFRRLALIKEREGERASNLQKARTDYAEILTRRQDRAYIGQETNFAWAEYGMGNVQSAVQLLEPLLDDSSDPSCENRRVIGCCYFRMGELKKAEEYISTGIEEAKVRPQLESLDQLMLAEIELEAQGWQNRNEAMELLGRLRVRIEAARQRLGAEPSAQAELLRLRDRYQGRPGTWMWIGVEAGLARLTLEGNELHEAATIYRSLETYSERFPETAAGLDKVADAYRIEGEGTLRMGWAERQASKKALESFDEALALRCENDHLGRGQLFVRKALAEFQMGADEPARASFSAAAAAFAISADSDGAAAQMAESCRHFLDGMMRFWALDVYLRGLEKEESTPEPLRSLLGRVVEELANYLEAELGAIGSHDYSNMPMVTPIILEVARNLSPAVGKENEWPVIKRWLPEMRERIEDDMGVRIPGVKVHSNESLPFDSYTILLDEVPIARGEVLSALRYSPSEETRLRVAGIPLSETHRAKHPLSRQDGLWVPAQYWDRVQQSSDCTLWPDPMQFAIVDLEAHLRQNLANFLGLQEMTDLLERWANNEDRHKLVEATLPDGDARDRFHRMLRLLLQEAVPITDLDRILSVTRQVGLDRENEQELLHRLRLALDRDLPGNQPNARTREMPSELESQIEAAVAKVAEGVVVVMAPRFAKEVSLALKALLGNDCSSILVIGHSELRLPARRILEVMFPHVAVQSREEIGMHTERDKQLFWIPFTAEWNELWVQEKAEVKNVVARAPQTAA